MQPRYWIRSRTSSSIKKLLVLTLVLTAITTLVLLEAPRRIGAAANPASAARAADTLDRMDAGALAEASMPVLPEELTAADLGNAIASSTSITPAADLRVIKVASPHNTVQVGDQFTYTILVDNLGPNRADNVVITDTLVTSGAVDPNGCSIAVRTDGGAIDEFTCNFALSTGVFDLATFGSNWLNPRSPSDMGRIIITINGTADAPTDMTNITTVTSDTYDPDTSNNVAVTTLSVTATADLRILKFVSPSDTVRAGDQFTYTILVDNLGPSVANNVVITDTLITSGGVDANGCSIAVRTDGGAIDEFACNFALSSGIFDLGTFGSNWLNPRSPSDMGRIIITINATATDPVDIDAVATVTSATVDPNLDNNYARVPLTVTAVADLAISSACTPDPLAAGEPLTCTFDVTNNGPSTAHGVQIEVGLPDVFDVLSIEGDTPSGDPAGCNAGTLGGTSLCSFGSLGSGISSTMTLTLGTQPDAVTDPVSDQRTIHIDAMATSETFDNALDDNYDHRSLTLEAEADLDLDVFAVGTPRAGEILHYEYNIDNLGPSVARDVTLRDFLPDEVEFQRAYIDVEGGSGGVPLPCTITSGSNALFCPIGDLAPTDGVPVLVFVDVLIKSDTPQGTTVTNNADLFLTDTPDPDSGNNSDSASFTVTTFAELTVRTTSEDQTPVAGMMFNYVVEVTNQGPSDAFDVVVTGTLPTGFHFVESSVDCSEPVPGTIACRPAGTGTTSPPYVLGAGERASFEVVADVDPDVSGPATLTADLGAGNPSFNVTTQDDTVDVQQEADLRILKIASPNTNVQAGQQFTYTLIVDNLGPSSAPNVVITDTLVSSGLVELNGCSLAVQTAGGSIDTFDCNLGTTAGVFDLATMGAAWLHPRSPDDPGRAIVILNLTANDALDLTDVATVTSDAHDPDTANNLAVTTLSVTAVADLGIEKTAVGQVQLDGQPGGVFAPQADRVSAGGILTYRLVITNYGPSTAENVVAYDRLPASVSVIGSTPDQGRCLRGVPGDPAAPMTCNLGDLAVGESVAIELAVAVSAAMPGGMGVYNEAFVTSEIYDASNANDFAAHETTVDAWADLNVTISQDSDSVLPGRDKTYTVAIENVGPGDAPGAVLSDTLPASFEAFEWTCTGSDGAVCVSNRTGGFLQTFYLPAGSEVSLVSAGTLGAGGTITRRVAVATSDGVQDPWTDNNTDAVTNAVHQTFLPVVMHRPQGLPDLVVTHLQATTLGVELTLKNQGSAPAEAPFWVDVYIDPYTPPTTVNQTWGDVGLSGLVWGVQTTVAPGAELTLTSGGSFYDVARSVVSWPLEVGTPVYVQVDSWNGATDYGAVLEQDDGPDAAYNNVAGPQLTTPWVAPRTVSSSSSSGLRLEHSLPDRR